MGIKYKSFNGNRDIPSDAKVKMTEYVEERNI